MKHKLLLSVSNEIHVQVQVDFNRILNLKY